ncbi:hypothetical protein [Sphingomonas abietis]|uniref:Uncharacterized protein n=1 Tax=Sphingomonas abietis TaxID=3012344 RepID=A0ABY7NPM0_9SPHN|nr:hypothetical protein [Sphingomonas abietis]WBO21426.1 hypothetical protein PBT88_14700 [Sphingomonas abietis]
MNPATSYFLIVLALQAAFTAGLILLVGRRFPARLRLYRWIAPAPVPILFFLLVVYAFVGTYVQFLHDTGMPFKASMLLPIGRFAIAYAVLWLIGLLFAGMLIRLVFRRR